MQSINISDKSHWLTFSCSPLTASSEKSGGAAQTRTALALLVRVAAQKNSDPAILERRTFFKIVMGPSNGNLLHHVTDSRGFARAAALPASVFRTGDNSAEGSVSVVL